MDSAELLDLLGNGNRRRILRLLAHKPCYVTEISEYLGVSPKAVIDHLRKLEEAGLVESRVDDKRRKYFHIARNLRLEVNVSPFEFGTKSAYPASAGLDITTCRYVSLDVDVDETDALEDGRDEETTDGETSDDRSETARKARELDRLQDMENELSMAQRWVHGRITEVMEDLIEEFDDDRARLYSDVLSALAAGASTPEGISRRVEAPPSVVREALSGLAEEEIAVSDGDEWRLPE
jgi:ArsR family transcriptional regulator